MATRSGKKLVLLVDDDRDACEELRDALSRDGYDVAMAHDGRAALALLRDKRPGVILLDLSMPVMDGWTFLELRRRDRDLATIPVVVLSAHAGPTRLAPYVGVAAVLAKPVDPDRLVAAIESASANAGGF